MASSSQTKLHQAFDRLNAAMTQLEAAADVALHHRAQSMASGEAVQAEITASWEAHSAQLEANLAEAQSENQFLKEDNLRLSNQLQQLQRDYLELQQAAGSTLARLDGSVKQIDLMLEH